MMDKAEAQNILREQLTRFRGCSHSELVPFVEVLVFPRIYGHI